MEINRTNANVALVGLDGVVVESTRLTVADRPVDHVLTDIVTACNAIRVNSVAAPSRLVGITISVPGPVNSASGSILKPVSFDSWHGVPVGTILSNELGLPS